MLKYITILLLLITELRAELAPEQLLVIEENVPKEALPILYAQGGYYHHYLQTLKSYSTHLSTKACEECTKNKNYLIPFLKECFNSESPNGLRTNTHAENFPRHFSPAFLGILSRFLQDRPTEVSGWFEKLKDLKYQDELWIAAKEKKIPEAMEMLPAPLLDVVQSFTKAFGGKKNKKPDFHQKLTYFCSVVVDACNNWSSIEEMYGENLLPLITSAMAYNCSNNIEDVTDFWKNYFSDEKYSNLGKIISSKNFELDKIRHLPDSDEELSKNFPDSDLLQLVHCNKISDTASMPYRADKILDYYYVPVILDSEKKQKLSEIPPVEIANFIEDNKSSEFTNCLESTAYHLLNIIFYNGENFKSFIDQFPNMDRDLAVMMNKQNLTNINDMHTWFTTIASNRSFNNWELPEGFKKEKFYKNEYKKINYYEVTGGLINYLLLLADLLGLDETKEDFVKILTVKDKISITAILQKIIDKFNKRLCLEIKDGLKRQLELQLDDCEDLEKIDQEIYGKLYFKVLINDLQVSTGTVNRVPGHAEISIDKKKSDNSELGRALEKVKDPYLQFLSFPEICGNKVLEKIQHEKTLWYILRNFEEGSQTAYQQLVTNAIEVLLKKIRAPLITERIIASVIRKVSWGDAATAKIMLEKLASLKKLSETPCVDKVLLKYSEPVIDLDDYYAAEIDAIFPKFKGFKKLRMVLPFELENKTKEAVTKILSLINLDSIMFSISGNKTMMNTWDGWQDLTEWLKSLPHLKNLIIRFRKFIIEEKSSLLFAETLGRQKSLRNLNLMFTDCKFSDNSTEIISKCISKLELLDELSLRFRGDTDIGSYPSKKIIEDITKLTNLTFLSFALPENIKFNYEEIESIMKAKLPKLEEIDLG